MKVDLSKPMTAQQRSEYINELLSSNTLTEGSAESRFANTQPAEPPPTIT